MDSPGGRVSVIWLLLVGCGGGSTPSYPLAVPEHFPPPPIPADAGLTKDKVELGRRLFYDKRLSVNETISCGSCHMQQLAFTDGKALSVGATGQQTPRGAMSLGNIVYASTLTWANPLLHSLSEQAAIPMLGEDPVEMGLTGHEDEALDRISAEPLYPPLFASVYGEGGITLPNVLDAIAAFEQTLVTADSPYDRWVGGDASAVSDAAERGWRLFHSERLECFHCHGGFNFSDSVDHGGLVEREVGFHNNGLYDIDGKGTYPPGHTGVHHVTGRAEDMGRYKAPTLRNIAVTAPYMHDGSLATLSDVLDHYAAGGKGAAAHGPKSDNALKSEFIQGFILKDDEKADVIAFLEALTDQTFLTDPKLSDPWATGR
jgi:cytochrome c peroxidase